MNTTQADTPIIDRFAISDFRQILRDAQVGEIGTLAAIAERAIRYYRASDKMRTEKRPFQTLEARWYESLARGTPDFSVYAEDEMLAETWACWVVYSRKYIKSLAKFDRLAQPKTVADLGCGLGVTTAALAQLFPTASVCGTQLRATSQWEIGSRLSERHGFSLVDDLSGQIDFIFASEFFEHLLRPIEYLENVITRHRPTTLVVANAFGATSVGHFETYWHNDVSIDARDMGRYFNRFLRERGYQSIETGFWNNRPAYWQKS
jgi:SAM-dependent methyltransferase